MFLRNDFFITFFLLLLLTIAGCSSTNGINSYNISFENDSNTYETGELHPFSVTVTDKNDEPISVDSVYMYINMEDMNHPLEGTMTNIASGKYEIALPLAMEGEWYVIVTVIDGDEEKEKQFTVYGEGERFMEYMEGYHFDEQ